MVPKHPKHLFYLHSVLLVPICVLRLHYLKKRIRGGGKTVCGVRAVLGGDPRLLMIGRGREAGTTVPGELLWKMGRGRMLVVVGKGESARKMGRGRGMLVPGK